MRYSKKFYYKTSDGLYILIYNAGVYEFINAGEYMNYSNNYSLQFRSNTLDGAVQKATNVGMNKVEQVDSFDALENILYESDLVTTDKHRQNVLNLFAIIE